LQRARRPCGGRWSQVPAFKAVLVKRNGTDRQLRDRVLGDERGPADMPTGNEQHDRLVGLEAARA
jgi:hypothetical protein